MRSSTKRRLTALTIATAFAVLPAGGALGDEAHQGCNGLDRAHHNTHGEGNQAEQRHHDLRAEKHCGH